MKLNQFLLWLLVLIVTATVAACGDNEAEKKSITNATHSAMPVNATLYGKKLELYIEVPALDTTKPKSAIAHLTWLHNYKPVTSGEVRLVFQSVTGKHHSFEKKSLLQDGIFLVPITLSETGTYSVSLSYKENATSDTEPFNLGELIVNNTVNEHTEHDQAEETGIKFLKEQQWIVDFGTAAVTQRIIHESIMAYSVFRPPANADIHVSTPVAGRLEAPEQGLPKIGSFVKAGQILARITPKIGGNTDITTLELTSNTANAKLILAEKELNRIRQLVKSGALAKKRLYRAQEKFDTAKAMKQASDNRLARYGLISSQKGKTINIRTPISGTVVQVRSVPGAMHKEGQFLFHIVNLDSIWLNAQISEVNVSKINNPAGAWLELPGGEIISLSVPKNARLVSYGNVIDKTTRTVPLILEFPNPEHRLRINTFIRAHIYTGQALNTLAIPESALVDDNGRDVVFVQIDGETFERRIVNLGNRDAEWIEVKQGLKAGERIVTKGAYLVHLAEGSTKSSGHGHGH